MLPVHANTSVKPHSSVPDYPQTNSQVFPEFRVLLIDTRQCTSVTEFTRSNGCISLFSIPKRKGINIERCKVTRTLLSPQSCRTVTLTPGAALPAGHCSTTDSRFGFFIYIQVAHMTIFSIKSLLSGALCTACEYKHEQSLRLMGPTSAQGPAPADRCDVGRGQGLAGEPFCTNPCLQSFAASLEKPNPWQKHGTKGQSLLVFPSVAVV